MYKRQAYASGFASIWTLIGLIFGTMLNWMVIANRLRIASEVFDVYSITEFFERRVGDKKGHVGLVAGIAVIVFMIINASAEIIGSGKLLNAIFGLDYSVGIVIGLAIMMIYTFLGGYMAVSWSNLFQGTLMFFAPVSYTHLHPLPAGSSGVQNYPGGLQKKSV